MSAPRSHEGMGETRWHDLGSVGELARHPLQQLTIGRTRIALSCRNGELNWKFPRRTGEGEPGFEEDCVHFGGPRCH